MRIEIQSAEFQVQSGTVKNGSRAGQSYSIRKQDVWVHLEGQPYPIRAVVNLEDNKPPYQPGFYKLDEKSFFVDRFNSLTLGRLALVPESAAPHLRATGTEGK